ncbi:hypothetical protein BCEN4_1230036 [Burkholderia cenocepacia]|nr:hypothetical protein BCEN4_1230036 [Burkholderia cenocepacia]
MKERGGVEPLPMLIQYMAIEKGCVFLIIF